MICEDGMGGKGPGKASGRPGAAVEFRGAYLIIPQAPPAPGARESWT
jgi:hypothetical protein